MDNWGKSADGISAKLKQLNSTLTAQKTQLSSLEKQYELTVNQEGEASKGAQELLIKINNQKAAIGNTEKQIRTYNTKLDEMQSESEEAAKASKEQQTALEKLKNTIKNQETELKSLKTQYSNVVLEQGESSDAAKDLASKINSLSGSLKDNKSKLSDTETAADKLDDSLDNLEDSTKDLKDSTKEANSGFTVMKGALANLVSQGINIAIDAVKDLASNVLTVGRNFESSMSNVKALSGATGKDLEMLEKTARKYGSTTQFSASEAADALGYMALAGWDAKQSTSALGGVLDLASASGMGLAESSDMVTDYLSAFGMEAKDSAYFSDLLAYAQANSNTTAQGLGEAYKNCAANLNAAGQDIETTTSLLGMMANQGLKGSEAGTTLTAIMRDMTAKMKNGSIQIGKTSVSVMDANGNYRDMTDILKDVEKATQGMGDAEKAAALKSTFTSDSIKGLNLILNGGVDNAADFEKELRNCSGTAKKMSKVMNDNLEGDLKSMNSAYEELGITLYKSANAPMRDIVKTITNDVLPSFTDMAKGVKGSSKKVGESVAKLIKDILTQLTSMLPQFTEFAASLITSLITGLLDSLPEIINAIVQMITTLLNSLGTMLPNIVNKIIEVVPLLVDALAEAIPTLLEAAIQFLLAIVNAIPEIIPPLIKAIPKITTALINGLIDAIPVLLEGAIQLLMAIVDAIPIIIDALIPEIPNITIAITKALIKNAPKLLKAAFTYYMEMVKAIPLIIVKLVKALPRIVTTFANALITPIKNLFGKLWESIKGIWNSVATWFNNNVIQPLVKFFQGLWDGIKKTFSPIVEWFKSLFKKVSSAIHTVVDPWVEIFRRIWNKIKEVFANVVNFFKEKFQNAWNKIKEVFNGVSTFFTNVWIKIKNVFVNVSTWFKNKFQTAWDNIKKVFEPVSKFFSGIWDGIKNTFGKVSDWFKNTFSDAWQKVKDVFSTGGKIFDGIKNGILTGLKAVINTLITGINKVIKIPFDGINTALRSIKKVSIVGVKPFDWINEISIPQIPKLAKGIGLAKKGHQYLLEGDGAEAVVPLEKNTSWLDEIAKRLSHSMNLQNNSIPQTINNTTNNFNQNNYSPKALSRLEIYRQSKNLLSAKGV